MANVADDAKIAIRTEDNRVIRVPIDDPLDKSPQKPPDDWEGFTETNGDVEYYYEDRDGTGKDFYPANPEPMDAKKKILDVVENEWGMSLTKVSQLRANHALFFDFIEAGSWKRAEQMIDVISNQEDWDDSQKEDILDAIRKG